jgi:hypothetical protein
MTIVISFYIVLRYIKDIAASCSAAAEGVAADRPHFPNCEVGPFCAPGLKALLY